MPQIWLTYDELGQFLHCTPFAAREACVTLAFKRRRCSDGQTRAKLHTAMIAEYLTHLADNREVAAQQPTLTEVARLRALAAEMRRSNTPLALRRA